MNAVTDYKDGWLTIRESDTFLDEPKRSTSWWPVVKESRANLEDMDGKVSHQDYYCAIADAIGRQAIEHLIAYIASVKDIRAALKTDENLNNIPLAKWDRQDHNVRQLVSRRAKEVMPISWEGTVEPGKFYWSPCETTCVLKAAATRMALEAK